MAIQPSVVHEESHQRVLTRQFLLRALIEGSITYAFTRLDHLPALLHWIGWG